jgi:hypothetical protein
MLNKKESDKKYESGIKHTPEINFIKNYIKKYIKKQGPIHALRVSSAGNVMARNGFYDGYFDVVNYEIRLSKKDQIVAYPKGRATRKYSRRNKAIKIANNLATEKNAVIITHLGILDNENEIKNIFFYLKNNKNN